MKDPIKIIHKFKKKLFIFLVGDIFYQVHAILANKCDKGKIRILISDKNSKFS